MSFALTVLPFVVGKGQIGVGQSVLEDKCKKAKTNQFFKCHRRVAFVQVGLVVEQAFAAGDP